MYFKEPFHYATFFIIFMMNMNFKLILGGTRIFFLQKMVKLFEAKDFGGVVEKTNSKAIWLDKIYPKQYRHISNILTVNRKSI